MKTLLCNLWKGPITSLMGLSLFVLGSLGMYNGKLSVMWDGSLVLFAGLVLAVVDDKKVKAWISKVFNLLLEIGKKSAPFLALLLLCSCGVIKSVDKTSAKSKVEVDSTARSTEKLQIDKVTTIEADTTLKVKGSKVRGSTPLSGLLKKPFVLETADQKITVKVDSLGNAQVAGEVKDRSVNLHFRKRIEEKIMRDREAQVSERKTASSETKTTDKDVQRFGLPWWVWLLLLLAAIFYALYRKWLPLIDR